MFDYKNYIFFNIKNYYKILIDYNIYIQQYI